MRHSALGFLICMSVGVVGASAQTQDPPAQPLPLPPQSPPVVRTIPDPNWRNVMEMRISEWEIGVRGNREAVRHERQKFRRAQRLARMVNDGRCHDAFKQALLEEDRDMAQRIADVCRGDRGS
ncbi:MULTISPECIES: hypothetical protein [unclassified Brevundimonas]|uniref:hypothetical protein n=1 Tax=unclassified Brevundimonas TaxID=2622653 RepID=UPI0025C1D3F3|nr:MULTISPECIES: hypothetical protein [unclassified Brevundimonas]